MIRVHFQKVFTLPLGLRAKLAAFTALVLVAACATLGWLFIRQQVETVTNGLLRSGTLLAQHFAGTSRYSVLAGDEQEIARLARGVVAADDVAYVVVMAKNGEISVSYGKNSWAELLPLSQDRVSRKARHFINPALSTELPTEPLVSVVKIHDQRPVVTPRNGFSFESVVRLLLGGDVPLYYDIAVPIPAISPMAGNDVALQLLFDEGTEHLSDPAGDHRPLGVIEIGLSTFAMQDLLKRLAVQVMALTIGIMVIGLIAIAILTHRVTIPLRNLTAVAIRVAAGKTSIDVPQSDNQDEIGNLAAAFSHMLQSIRQRESALTELNQTLEDRVLTRTEELQVANAKLQALDRRKSLFVSTASHELRTPLTSMKVHLENLLDGIDGPLTAPQNVVLRRIHVNLGRLQLLLEELLDLSRIELGQTSLDIQAVNVEEVVTQSIESLQPVVVRKGVTIDNQLPTDFPLTASDRNKLQQVLTNLLHNALKFSPQGAVVVVSGEHTLDGYVRIAVRDAGPGINSDDRGKIFEPFYRSPHVSSHILGTGLGLAIAKHLVELHQGRLWAESVLGQGSCFIFTLPVWTASHMPNFWQTTRIPSEPVG